MKKILLACFAIALFTVSAYAQTSKSKAQKGKWIPVDSATMMKAMMENMMPGKQHAMLAKFDGEWEAEMKMWMEPGEEPMTAKGKSVNKMVLGGRYQQTIFTGEVMGMPFEGTGFTGYDNTKKVFTTSWMDNMSTTPMSMEGAWIAATKSIIFKGKMLCGGNNMEMEMREVFKIVDDNTQIMEMWGPDMKTGKEFKHMEITYNRKN
jgi:hypothetical protein